MYATPPVGGTASREMGARRSGSAWGERWPDRHFTSDVCHPGGQVTRRIVRHSLCPIGRATAIRRATTISLCRPLQRPDLDAAANIGLRQCMRTGAGVSSGALTLRCGKRNAGTSVTATSSTATVNVTPKPFARPPADVMPFV